MKHIQNILVVLAALILAGTGLVSLGIEQNIPKILNEDDGSDSLGLNYHGHVDVMIKRAGADTWQLVTSEDNLLTENGANYTRTQIGSGTVDPWNASTKYISLSATSTAPAASWYVLPSEITTNGFAKAAGTYALNNTCCGASGVGMWNYTYTWTATGAQTVNTTGLGYNASGNVNDLFAALAIAPSTNLTANDQLKVIWSISVS